jgi:hypothetical protein
MDASRQRFAQQFSFSQIAGMAGWGSSQNVSRRFPLLVVHDSKHAEDLCGALNLRLARARPSTRCGWLTANDFSDHERLDIETTISQVLEATLTEQFAEDVHTIARDALDVYETILAKITEHDFHTQMDTSEKCYVFVRFFPELRDPCPFVKWVVVPDDKLHAAMDATAQEWACENAEKIWDRLLARSKHLGIPQTPGGSHHDEGLEKMLRLLNQRGGAFAEVPKELAELLREFMPREPRNVDDVYPPGRSGAEAAVEPATGTGGSPEDSQGKQSKQVDAEQSTAAEIAEETLDEQNDASGKTSVSDDNRDERQIRLANWAIAVENGTTFWLFHRRGQIDSWRESGKVDVPKGLQRSVLLVLADNEGSLTKAEVIKAFQATHAGMSNSQIRQSVVTPTLNKLRSTIKAAIARVQKVPVEIADPLPYDQSSKAWQSKILVGFAEQDDDLKRLRFVTKSRQTAELEAKNQGYLK